MKGWNPFGKVDMEVGSFLKKSPFNKEYEGDQNNVNKKQLVQIKKTQTDK